MSCGGAVSHRLTHNSPLCFHSSSLSSPLTLLQSWTLLRLFNLLFDHLLMFSSYLQSVYSLTSHSFCVPPAYFLFFPLCAPFLIHYSAARDCNKPWDNFSKILSILLSFLMSDTFLCGILNISVHLIQKRDGVLMKSSSGNAIVGEIFRDFKRVAVLSHHSFPKSSSNFFAPPQS